MNSLHGVLARLSSLPVVVHAMVILAPGAPVWAQAAAIEARTPTRSDAVRFVSELDACFNRGDLDSYFGRFVCTNRGCFATQLRERIGQLAAVRGVQACSRVTSFAVRKDVGIVLANTRYSCTKVAVELTSLIAFRRSGVRDTGLFAIEVDPGQTAEIATREAFTCAACNYEIRFGGNWLMVPVPPILSGCMESMWIVSLDHDLHIEAAVHVGDKPLAARDAMSAILDSARARSQISDAKGPTFHDWSPKQLHAGGSGMPQPCTSVRCVRHCSSHGVAELNLVAIGRLRYLFVVRGSRDVIERNRGDIDAVLDSFRVLDPDIPPADLAPRSIFVHTGRGCLDARNTYTNPSCDLSIAGPRGWHASLRPGGWVFELEFRHPTRDSRFVVHAFRAVDHGWSRDMVDAMIRDYLTRSSADVFAEIGWRDPAAGGFTWRQTAFRAGPANAGHVVRYALRRDILLVMDAMAAADEDRDAMAAAMESLRALQ